MREIDYYTNYMDYTNDVVSVMFTKGQGEKMRNEVESINWKTGTKLNEDSGYASCGPCMKKVVSVDEILQEPIITRGF